MPIRCCRKGRYVPVSRKVKGTTYVQYFDKHRRYDGS